MWSITTQVRNARRRARKQGLAANLSLEEWLKTLEDFGYCCAYCGIYCHGLSSFATIEHYISLAAGGGTCVIFSRVQTISVFWSQLASSNEWV